MNCHGGLLADELPQFYTIFPLLRRVRVLPLFQQTPRPASSGLVELEDTYDFDTASAEAGDW